MYITIIEPLFYLYVSKTFWSHFYILELHRNRNRCSVRQESIDALVQSKWIHYLRRTIEKQKLQYISMLKFREEPRWKRNLVFAVSWFFVFAEDIIIDIWLKNLEISNSCKHVFYHPLHKKWSFPLRISSVNGKLHFLCSDLCIILYLWTTFLLKLWNILGRHLLLHFKLHVRILGFACSLQQIRQTLRYPWTVLFHNYYPLHCD